MTIQISYIQDVPTNTTKSHTHTWCAPQDPSAVLGTTCPSLSNDMVVTGPPRKPRPVSVAPELEWLDARQLLNASLYSAQPPPRPASAPA